MAVNNEKVSGWLTKLLVLAILVAGYFAYAIVPHVMDFVHIRQMAITVYKQKDLAVPEFTKERKVKLVKELCDSIKKDYNVVIKPKEVDFATGKKDQHLTFSYEINAKLPLAEQYILLPFTVNITGNP